MTSLGAAPPPSRMRLRPLSLGEMLDAAIRLYCANWRTLLKTVVIVVVPAQILITVADAGYTVSSLGFDTSTSEATKQSLENLNRHVGGLAAAALLQLTAIVLATALSFRAIAQDYLGEAPDWRASVAHARRRLGPLLALTVLYVAGVGLGTAAFAVPGVWLFVVWAVATPVLLVEGLQGRAALRRSVALVEGRWWQTFGRLFVGFLLAGILSTVVQGVFAIGIVHAHGDALVLALSAVAGIAGMLLSTPLQAALLTVMYFDLRVRREGYDLELLAFELGAAPAPDAGVGSSTRMPAPTATDKAPTDAPPPPTPVGAGVTAAPTGAMPPPPGWRPPAAEADDVEA
jgi:hypothetical protein